MSSPFEVVHCDNHLVVVAKPGGLATVPDESGDESLFECTRSWIEREFHKPGRAFLGIVHRLDRPVSGLVVFARTSKAAARLSQELREGRFHKLYWAIGAGGPAADSGEIVEWLLKDERRNVVTPVREGTHAARRAVTRWRVLARGREQTVYAFEPLSGRAHQLRSAARALGTPLLGDLKYGASAALPDKTIALHALALRFRHPTRAEDASFECAPPANALWSVAARLWAERNRGD